METTFDGKRAFEHIRYLANEIGPRLSGSPGDYMAQEYVRNYFSSLNLPVVTQSFDMPGGCLRSHRLEIIEPAIGEIASYPFLFSSDTPAEGLSGEIVFVEGVNESVLGPHLHGKIVIWALNTLHENFTFYPKLTRWDPLAVILLYPGLGVGPKHLQIFDNVPKIHKVVPTFYISWEDGVRLYKMGAKRAAFHLLTDRSMAKSANIIAELKGKRHPEQIVVVGGHLDSVSDVAGAMDNAAGVAVVMELARIFAQRGSERTIRFIAWGAEEFGLMGSRYYLKELKKRDAEERARENFAKGLDKTEMDNHLCVVALDVVGLTFAKDVYFVLGPDELLASMRLLANELGMWCDVKADFYGTDAEPFAIEGIPSIACTSYAVPSAHYMHGVEDTIDNLDEEHVRRQGMLMEAFLTRYVANAKIWAFERNVPEKLTEEAKEMLESFGWVWNPL